MIQRLALAGELLDDTPGVGPDDEDVAGFQRLERKPHGPGAVLQRLRRQLRPFSQDVVGSTVIELLKQLA